MGILVDKNTPVFYVTGQYYDVKVRKEINVSEFIIHNYINHYHYY